MALRYFTYIASVPDTSYTYSRYAPFKDAAWAGIKTSGSSTTISSGTVGDAAFRGMGVGDLLWIRPSHDAATVVRKIVTWTDVDTIVVDSAITITVATTAWSWQKYESGTTTATAPRHSLRDYRKVSLNVTITTLGSSDATLTLLGWSGNEIPTTIYTNAYTATGSVTFPINEAFSSVSVGLKAATPSTDVITISLVGEEI